MMGTALDIPSATEDGAQAHVTNAPDRVAMAWAGGPRPVTGRQPWIELTLAGAENDMNRNAIALASIVVAMLAAGCGKHADVQATGSTSQTAGFVPTAEAAQAQPDSAR